MWTQEMDVVDSTVSSNVQENAALIACCLLVGWVLICRWNRLSLLFHSYFLADQVDAFGSDGDKKAEVIDTGCEKTGGLVDQDTDDS